jgi:hypothetical protein
VYECDEVKGTYPTRAEARRAQQRFREIEIQILAVSAAPQIDRAFPAFRLLAGC